MMLNHPTVKVVCPLTDEGDLIDIDAELAPLMPLVWDLGIDTRQCCQEKRPGLAAIEFPTTAGATDFLYSVQRPYAVELETREEQEKSDNGDSTGRTAY